VREVKNAIWGRGLAENVRIPSYMGRGSKIAQKPSYDIYLNVPYGARTALIFFVIFCLLLCNFLKAKL